MNGIDDLNIIVLLDLHFDTESTQLIAEPIVCIVIASSARGFKTTSPRHCSNIGAHITASAYYGCYPVTRSAPGRPFMEAIRKA